MANLEQGHFGSLVLDEDYVRAAARYVEFNPVRARLVRAAGDLRWSSAGAHLQGQEDWLVSVAPPRKMVADA
jgi:putative transposase